MSIHPDAKQRSVTVNGRAVEYFDTEKKGSAPIVLLHGTGGSAAAHFSAVFAMLAARHRVIAVNFSKVPSGTKLTVEELVDQAAAVITAAAPEEPVTLVGYSLGAVVAAATAARHSTLVENLVLVAGWIKSDGHQLVRNELWSNLRNSDSEALRKFVVYTSYGAPFLASKCKADIEVLVNKVTNSPERDSHMELNRRIDISADVEKISARTLVVLGEYDQMVPKHHGEALFGTIKDARIATIPSGHAIVFERPAQLFSLIDSFVTNTGAYPAGAVVPAPTV